MFQSSSQSQRMPSPSLCRPEFSLTWRKSSRSTSSKEWRSISSIRWSMKRSLSALDLPSPLSRSESMKRNKHTHTIYKHSSAEWLLVIWQCICRMVDVRCKHSPTQSRSRSFLSSLQRCSIIPVFITPICVWSCNQALEAVNTQLRELYPDSEELFDVVLMTNNHAYVGLRLINTINHHRELTSQIITKRGIFLWDKLKKITKNDAGHH